MVSHTIKVTGVSEELLQLLDERLRAQHATGRSEYIRELIRRDVLSGANQSTAESRTFRDLLDPVQEVTQTLGETEEESEAFLQAELEAHRRERGADDRHAGE